MSSFLLGLIKKIAWTLPLCVVLALVLQRSWVMGVAGLFTAPLATLFSSILDSQLRELWLNVTSDALSWASLQNAAFRGLEYGVLGALIGFLTQQKQNSLGNHIYVGTLVGFIFGGFVIYTKFQPGFDVIDVILQNVSKFLFPVDCAMILKIKVYDLTYGAMFLASNAHAEVIKRKTDILRRFN